MAPESSPPDAARGLWVVGTNHRTTPLELRERLNLAEDRLRQLQARLQARRPRGEFLILPTCNRLELYAAGGGGADALLEDIAAVTGVAVAEWRACAYLHQGVAAVQHLFRVASGLDSQMIGETEILGQVKAAYARAEAAGLLGPTLHRVCQKAFQAAKRARSETGIGVGQVSLGNVAVDLAERIFGVVTEARVLVVGSGEVGQDVAKAFRSRGVAAITISSRTPERARELALGIGAATLPFAAWPSRLAGFDVVLCATAAPGLVLDLATAATAARQRAGQPLFLIDLAMPRDIDPAAADLADVYLYNLGDLAAIANENLAARQAEVARCEALLAERAGALRGLVEGS